MDKLLLELIELLNEESKCNEKYNRENLGRTPARELRVDYMDAVFYMGRKKLGSLGVIQAMDALANGIHRFEDFDLNDATKVKLERL